ncbi:hypothetical protein Zm00014a_014186 [Zea mays]|uniref:Uncharacterized protein n=1 Tax=Zea mays TaxID=4577 RepID=A0A3L6F6S8_MAIZE|nr:hypothetical protein Zm00014a_014186 [Zea mays]
MPTPSEIGTATPPPSSDSLSCRFRDRHRHLAPILRLAPSATIRSCRAFPHDGAEPGRVLRRPQARRARRVWGSGRHASTAARSLRLMPTSSEISTATPPPSSDSLSYRFRDPHHHHPQLPRLLSGLGEFVPADGTPRQPRGRST